MLTVRVARLRASSRLISTTATRLDNGSSSRPSRSIYDSTSALDYKSSHRVIPPPLPAMEPRTRTPEEAVTNILYNTPPPNHQPFKRHVLNCLVQNEPGVLSRVSGILAGRGFNIDSLVVCRTEIRDLSRMCIVLRGQEGVVEQARRQLEDLVPVWAVLDYTDTPKIQRELLLVKVSLLGPEYLEDQLVGGPHHDPRLTAQQAAAAHAQAQYEAQDSQSVEASTQEEPHVSTGAASHDGTMPSVLEQTMAEGQAGTDAGHATEIHQSTQANVSLSTPTPSSGMTTAPDPANSEPQPLYNPHTPPGQQVQDIQQIYQAHQTYTHAAAEAEGYPSGPLSPQSHGPQPTPLTPSQALQLRAQHMHAISVLSAQFGAKMVDVSENSAIVELAAKTQRVDAFLRLLSPYGILESARSGMMTLPRTPLKPSAEEDEMGMDGAGVDMSMLPPG